MRRARLGELELAVMDYVWKVGQEITVPDVHAYLTRKRKLAYTTTMTVMSRLYEKGFLDRSESKRPYVYRPALVREDYSADLMLRALREVKDRKAALARFVEKISKKDAQLLLELARRTKGRRR